MAPQETVGVQGDGGLDRLSGLLERCRVRAHLFHAGPLCGTTHFAAEPGRGFLHVMRRGEMTLSHPADPGMARRLHVREPSLLFYPRPLAHDFHNAPAEGSDFTCATLEFEGGDAHPLVRALPPLIVLPLAQVEGLESCLGLLFAETGRVQCGQRLMADRLFEVLLMQLLRWMLAHPEASGLPAGLLRGLGHPQLARALVAVHERPGDAWSLERMAAAAGMSRSRFAGLFKDLMGDTPAEYLLGWRLGLACQALRQGQPVKQLADALGYATPSAFSRAFAQRMGCSPREWLARQAR
ncbi:AraC family transcriptional regulator [Roseateles sp. DB2]|uniref:AraC family transcriptional regulator n=1 Tax=Roseateles sp. DB2 TaxID=3453717 RepID=UPI003EEB0AE5